MSRPVKPTEIHPPYGEIGDLLRAGRVVPVLGAGASAIGRPVSPKWQWQPTAKIPPTGADLAKFLADKAEFPSAADHERSDLPRVSSYFAEISGRGRLRERLREILAVPYRPGPVHEFLARLPGRHLFVVTNYDTLLERAFRVARVPYDLVYYPTDRPDAAGILMWWKHREPEPVEVEPEELRVDTLLKQRTVVYKMHGTIFEPSGSGAGTAAAEAAVAARDSFVITEEDYVEFLSRMAKQQAMPSSFKAHFSDRHFLFLGYSLRDWNFRLLLGDLHLDRTSRGGEARIVSWAIQFRPSELERRLWSKRGVDIYDRDLDDFVKRMIGALGPARGRGK
jgi:hypothetical protein